MANQQLGNQVTEPVLSMNMREENSASNMLVGSSNNSMMKTARNSSQELSVFNRELKTDSCSIVAFEMQDYSNSDISETSSLKVINLSDFIPTVTDGSYETVLVSEALLSRCQDGLSTETIPEKVSDSQKYYAVCRICANETVVGLPLFHNQGLTFEIVEKIHRCLPIKVSVNDGLPQHVCDECVSKLDIADDLYKLSIEGNAKLQAMGINWTNSKEGNISNQLSKENNDTIIQSEEEVLHGKEQLHQDAEIPNNVEILLEGNIDTSHSIDLKLDNSKMCQNIKSTSQKNADASQSSEIVPNEEPFDGVDEIDSPQMADIHPGQSDCNFLSPRESALNHHKEAQEIERISEGNQMDASNELFTCEYCDKNFHTETRWKKHVLSHSKLVMQHKDTCEKCTKCNEEFFTAKDLQRHLKDVHNIKPDRKYDCDICGKSYGNASGLDIHRSTHSNETPYLCDICGKSFKHRSNLRCHKKSHGSEKETHRHTCDICPKSFPSKFHLSEHRNVHLNLTPYSCTICDKKFHRRIQLRQHKTVHNSNSIFECPQCGVGFNRRGNMTQHMKRHSTERKFSCKVCKKSFDTLSEVVQHRREHTVQELKDSSEEKQTFTCSECQKTFHTSKGLEEHTKKHSSTSFECELCNKQLSNRRTLEYHIRSFHTQERPFSCQFCSMSFISRENCTVHERLHTGEKPYTCPECSMSFRCASNLAQHLSTHKDERPWACNQCPKRFKRNGILLVHMRTHTGEKPFCCDICGRRFTQKNDMLKHQQTHKATNQNYVCGECHWPFHTRKELNKHRRTHHIISRTENTASCAPVLSSQSQALVISDNLNNFPITILEGSDVVVHQIEDLGQAQILEIDPLLQDVSDSQILTIQSTSESVDSQLTSFVSEGTVSVLPSCSQQNW